MKLFRVTVEEFSNPIKFWMTEEQTKYFSNFLLKTENEFTISRSNYEILTGVLK